MEFLSSCVIKLLIGGLVYVSERVKGRSLQRFCCEQLSPANAAIQYYLHIAGGPAMHYPNMCLSGKAFQSSRFFFFNAVVLCFAGAEQH